EGLNDDYDFSIIPRMKTDLTLRSGLKTIIFDAKYYADPFPTNYGTRKVRSSHLYQLFSYIKTVSEKELGSVVEGALIYASAGPHESPHFGADSYWPNFIDKSLRCRIRSH
ncbi:MAG: hypothetical protein P4M15_05495, partial [Alphaproteobacteria bacterium]|nr:hypothetical protein [Alphaproteobacteria bacterium]